jgi:hypothetical protein
MHGQAVCHAHGGLAPQARRAAAYRLAAASSEIKAARVCLSLGIWRPPEEIQQHIAEAYLSLGVRP